MLGGDPVPDHRIGEHVGAVAQRRDDKGVRRGELGAERRAETPAETAGRAEREEGARLLARAMIGPQRIFIEDDGVFAGHVTDRARQIFRRNCRAGRGILGQLRAPGTHALGEPCAPGGDACFRHLQARFDRFDQRLQRVDAARLHARSLGKLRIG